MTYREAFPEEEMSKASECGSGTQEKVILGTSLISRLCCLSAGALSYTLGGPCSPPHPRHNGALLNCLATAQQGGNVVCCFLSIFRM